MGNELIKPHRYLAVSDCDNHYTIHLPTGTELPDGYVSPNDRMMLVFDTTIDAPQSLEIAYLAPGIREFELRTNLSFHQVQWINETEFYAVISGDSYMEYYGGEQLADGSWEALSRIVEEPFFDIKSISAIWRDGSYQLRQPFSVSYIQPNQFTYEAGSGLIELGSDGYNLDIMQHRHNRAYLIDLSPYLDEPIVSAEWLPSLFYYEADWEN